MQKRFVPVAIDVWYEQRRQDPVGEFFYHVVDQGRNKGKDRNLTRQGLYCFTADGVLLADTNHRAPDRWKEILNRALQQFDAQQRAVVSEQIATDQRFDRHPPKDGLIVDVFGRILLEGEAMQAAIRINPRNSATSRDHLWITASEVRAIAQAEAKVGMNYPVPLALAHRIARFHLIDNIRGEPPMWEASEIRALEMNLQVEKVAGSTIRLKLTGKFDLSTASQNRTYQGGVLGALEYDAGNRAFTRFDIVALGMASGEGTYTPRCPQGEFPLAIAFRLADLNSQSSKVPPQAARGLQQYLSP